MMLHICRTITLELARQLGKPEVGKMVAKDLLDRFSANSMLEFVRSNSSIKAKRFRPTLGLLFALFREDDEYSHLTQDEILEFAVRYHGDSNLKPRPKPGTGQETTGSQGDGSRRSARTGSQELADLPVSKLLVLGAELGVLGLDSALGMLALTSTERIRPRGAGRSLGTASEPVPTPSPTAATRTAETKSTESRPAESKAGSRSSRPAGAGANVVASTSTSNTDLPPASSKGEHPARKGEGRSQASETGRVRGGTQEQVPQQPAGRRQQQGPQPDSTSESSAQQRGRGGGRRRSPHSTAVAASRRGGSRR